MLVPGALAISSASIRGAARGRLSPWHCVKQLAEHGLSQPKLSGCLEFEVLWLRSHEGWGF